MRMMIPRRSWLASLVVFLLLSLTPILGYGQAQRVIVLKVDGLPGDLVDEYVRQHDPLTNKSVLPWFDYVFYQRGTRFANFYVRGMSLSGPSWSLLDTGQHLQIKGNVEYDRISLHAYDYLNFLPFYVNYARSKRVDMPGVEVMDEIGLPLLLDAFKYEDRYNSFQLYQRGNRWSTMQRGLMDRFVRSPRELLDEWTVGIDTRSIFLDRSEKELIEKLNDPKIEYLDYYSTDFDHTAHHNRDRASQLAALKTLDGTIGRIWTAVERSALADKTAMFIVSDHGFNSDPNVYSQGFNLVHLLGSREGGGHHVITKRRLMLDYAVKGLYPLVPLITTTTEDSYYLKGQSTEYPTVLLDFDGNERSSLHLRDADLNELQILLQQMQSKELSPAKQSAATDEFFRIIEHKRPDWRTLTRNLTEQLGALERWIAAQQAEIDAQPKKWTPEQMDLGLDQDARRVFAGADSARSDLKSYREYLVQMQSLLTLQRSTFAPRKVKIESLIPPRFMGDRNSVYDLQNYVVGLAPTGLIIGADGKFDRLQSFVRVNYFDLLLRQTVRNNVQVGISNHPIDFTVVRIPREQLAESLAGELRPNDDVVWVYGGAEKQALILARTGDDGRLSLRYLPISDLRQLEDGTFHFYLQEWSAGFPLQYFEDPKLNVPVPERAQWLSEWHTDVEWLRAIHKTHYSNGLIGLHEQMVRHPLRSLDADQPGLTVDERLLRRFRSWQRNQTETDLLILANNHWNFDVRGFNPGGNHGSFYRISTNSTLMVAGGAQTGVP
ncbi:MAG: alkaline phosphatase family protein, partial [Pyrinomonadaceae bacterium]